jgi:hypothetical protein
MRIVMCSNVRMISWDYEPNLCILKTVKTLNLENMEATGWFGKFLTARLPESLFSEFQKVKGSGFLHMSYNRRYEILTRYPLITLSRKFWLCQSVLKYKDSIKWCSELH